MVLEDLQSVFEGWSASDLATREVTFTENFKPDFDPKTDDYRIVYEALFEPQRLDAACIHFSLTDAGYVGMGIETYGRLAQRLSLHTIRSGWVVGHEPRSTTPNILRKYFSAVARGQVMITVNSAFGFVTSPKLYIPEADFESISQSQESIPH
jgi:hypothetical protein